MFNTQTYLSRTNIATRTWAANVVAAGGGFENNSRSIANSLISALRSKSYYSRLIYLLPMLGKGVNAARVPLIDRLNVGAATSVSFVDADFSQSTGLQGNGTTKYLDSLIKPSQIGSSNNGGLGFWENNISFGANVEPIGCYNNANTDRFALDLRNTIQAFRWGGPSNGPQQGSTSVNGHYYGQRSSITNRIVCLNGSQIASNTTSDATSGSSDRNMLIVGLRASSIAPWPGRCALAYMTDGTFSAGEIADLHSTLMSYLMIPTGKPTS